MSVDRGEQDAQQFWLSVIDAWPTPSATTVGRARRRHAGVPQRGGGRAAARAWSGSTSRWCWSSTTCTSFARRTHSGGSSKLLTRVPAKVLVVLSTVWIRARASPPPPHGGSTGGPRRRSALSLEETRRCSGGRGRARGCGRRPLHERTEGWAAGLRLAAISLAAHPDRERFVSSSPAASDRGGLAPGRGAGAPAAEARDLLLRTSILERVSGPLADYAHRRRGRRGEPPAARGPERVRDRDRRRPDMVPLPPPVRRSAAPRAATQGAGDDPVAAPRRGRLA